jgi:hypothetical protein
MFGRVVSLFRTIDREQSNFPRVQYLTNALFLPLHSVKFGDGIPGRYARMVQGNDRTNNLDCVSVLLNPTLIDTRPSGSVISDEVAMSSQNPDGITLQLRYSKDDVASLDPNDTVVQASPESTGGVLPLADYILIG